MTPGERGLLPACVRAERLGNGVVKYTRTTHPAGNETLYPVIRDTSSALDKSRLSSIQRTKQQSTLHNEHNTNTAAVKYAPYALEEMRTNDFPLEDKSRDVRIMAIPLYHDFSKLPTLTSVPKCGDYIAYKVLELGKDYTPRISEYKEAEVLHYDEESKTVTLHLLHNKKGETRTAGKFDLPSLLTKEDVTDKVTLEMSSLLDPKVLRQDQRTEI